MCLNNYFPHLRTVEENTKTKVKLIPLRVNRSLKTRKSTLKKNSFEFSFGAILSRDS